MIAIFRVAGWSLAGWVERLFAARKVVFLVADHLGKMKVKI